MRHARYQFLPFVFLCVSSFAGVGSAFAAGINAPAPADPVEVESTETSYIAQGSILAVRGSSLVLICEDDVALTQGTPFEVFVELPGDLGTAIIARGQIITADDGLLIGKVTSRDDTATLSTTLKVRFLNAPTTADPVPADADEVATPDEQKPADTSGTNDFRSAVERYKQAVMLVKDNNNQSHGTAFVISKQHRLLVTNAHVADIANTVVLNETRTEYKVIRRWFHPDTIRKMREDNQTVIKSSDPAVGTVDPSGTDLAVLQLELIGPDLPSEVVLASPEEAKTIVGAEIGMYGYPAYNTKAEEGQFAQATFVQGTISRLERLNGHSTDQQVEDRRRVVYAGPNYPGFSGSPIFLSNGRVVVINNAILRLQDGTKVAYGMRVDALWDMLGHFQLADKIDNASETLPEPIFITTQNPQVEKLLTAKKLIASAQEHQRNRNWEAALEDLKQAETTADWYWAVYLTRAKLVDAYINVTTLSKEEQAKLYEASRSYFSKAAELHYKSFNTHALPILLDFARQSINSARFGGNTEVLKEAIKILDDKNVLKVALEGENAAYFLALRATVKKDLDLLESALADIDEALRLQPNHQTYLTERDSIVRQLQRSGIAQARTN